MARTSASATAVAKKEEAKLPAGVYDYGEYAGAGFEGTSGADLSIPFLSVLQSNSPQVEDDNPKGSKPGLIINTVTGELLEQVAFLPVHKESAYVEWVPRDQGGGFVGLHDVNSEEVKRAIQANGGVRIGKLTAENGNELIETFYVYGLILNEEGTETTGFGVLSFTSTKIKVYKKWTTAMYTLKGRPPLFANRALIKTTKEKNDKGSFFNFSIEPLKDGSWIKSLINPRDEAALLQEAKEFRDMVLSGMARAAFETQNSTGDGGGGNPEEAPF